jgi:ATP-dependent exoDNAse (exonuclease V) beta subunit
VLALVRDARTRGYAWGDIAILTPGNEGVINAGAWLNQEGIPFVSHSTLDIRSRKVVGELLALLRFLDAPVDSLAFATFLMGNLFTLMLEREGAPGVARDLYAELVRLPLSSGPPLYRRFRQNQPQLWDTLFAPLFTGVGHLPVYDLLATVCKVFDVYTLCPGEEGAVLKLLEVAKDFEQEGDNSLKEFLARAADPSGEDEAAWTLTPPSGAAVTLMTIHKAKGMQFPLVIVLYYDSLPGVAGPLMDDRGETIELVRVTRNDAQWSPRLGEMYRRAARDNLTDQFNRLYVALTRAQNEMYVVSAGDSEQPMRFPGRVLTPPPAGPRPVRDNSSAVRQAPAQPLAPLHVPGRAPATVAEHTHIGYRATRRGDQLHAVLARIGTVPDPAALEIPMDNSIPPEEWTGIRKTIASFLAAPDVAPLFADRTGRVSVSEQECVSRDGNLLRVDRLVVDPESVTVIDFKSGETEDQEGYDRQVSHYMEVMRDLYPGRRISGAIAYVDLCRVRRIG